jgi:hypothetical protein
VAGSLAKLGGSPPAPATPLEAPGEGPSVLLPALGTLRAAGPVHPLPGKGFVLIGFAEVRAALAQPQIFSSACLAPIDAVLLGADPPAQARVRQRLARHFTPEALAVPLATIEEEAMALLAPELDVVSGYALPLTRAVAGALLGLPSGDVQSLVDAFGSRFASGIAWPDLPVAETLRGSVMYRRLREGPADALSDAEACSLVGLLAAAASITAERLIIRCVLALLEEPRLLAEIRRSGGQAIASLVEEVARLYPPEPNPVRVATQDHRVAGVVIPAGALVYLSLAAANRDPAQFESPDALRLDRKGAHLAFGSGPHQCIGAGLGRRTAAAAVAALALPPRRLRPAEPLQEIGYRMVQGMALPARLKVAL